MGEFCFGVHMGHVKFFLRVPVFLCRHLELLVSCHVLFFVRTGGVCFVLFCFVCVCVCVWRGGVVF